MIIRLCMCKGWTHDVKVLESKLHCKTANTFGFFLQVTVKWQSKRNVSDEMCQQNFSEWCRTSHWTSGQCTWRIDLNDNRHAAFLHESNCIILHTDLVHMVQILEVAYGRSWTSRRRSWIRNGEEVKLYLPKTSEIIYMRSIAGQKCGNLIGPRLLSLR